MSCEESKQRFREAFDAGFAQAGFAERATDELFEAYYPENQQQRKAFRQWWASALPPTPWNWPEFIARDAEHRPGQPTNWGFAPDALRILIMRLDFHKHQQSQISPGLLKARPYVLLKNHASASPDCGFENDFCTHYEDPSSPMSLAPCWRYDCHCRIFLLTQRELAQRGVNPRSGDV